MRPESTRRWSQGRGERKEAVRGPVRWRPRRPDALHAARRGVSHHALVVEDLSRRPCVLAPNCRAHCRGVARWRWREAYRPGGRCRREKMKVGWWDQRVGDAGGKMPETWEGGCEAFPGRGRRREEAGALEGGRYAGGRSALSGAKSRAGSGFRAWICRGGFVRELSRVGEEAHGVRGLETRRRSRCDRGSRCSRWRRVRRLVCFAPFLVDVRRRSSLELFPCLFPLPLSAPSRPCSVSCNFVLVRDVFVAPSHR